jgi:hypothetical protein
MGSIVVGRGRSTSRLSVFRTILPAVVSAACSANHGAETGESSAVERAAVREGACALHVDPGAVAEGDGSSWASPLRSVQAAIDAQDARGGGWLVSGAAPPRTQRRRRGPAAERPFASPDRVQRREPRWDHERGHFHTADPARRDRSISVAPGAGRGHVDRRRLQRR